MDQTSIPINSLKSINQKAICVPSDVTLTEFSTSLYFFSFLSESAEGAFLQKRRRRVKAWSAKIVKKNWRGERLSEKCLLSVSGVFFRSSPYPSPFFALFALHALTRLPRSRKRLLRRLAWRNYKQPAGRPTWPPRQQKVDVKDWIPGLSPSDWRWLNFVFDSSTTWPLCFLLLSHLVHFWCFFNEVKVLVSFLYIIEFRSTHYRL